MTGKPSSPCQDRSRESQYDDFVQRHILGERFDRNSRDAWERYLKEHHLWCRTSVQSFIENDVQDVNMICSNDGRRLTETVTYAGNLCISNSNMLIYDVTFKKTNSGCDINVASNQRPVIVACNKVGNRCLPVHFQKYEHQTPSNMPCSRAGLIMIE